MRASDGAVGVCSRTAAAQDYDASWEAPVRRVKDTRSLNVPVDSSTSAYQRHVRGRVRPGRCLPSLVTADEVITGAEWFFADRANCQHSPGRRVDQSYLLAALRVVASKADYRTGRFAEISRYTLMREASLTESTAKRCLAVLQKAGFLVVIANGYRNKNTNHAEANVYQLALPQEAADYVRRQAPRRDLVENSDPVPRQGEVLNTPSPKSRVNTRPARGLREVSDPPTRPRNATRRTLPRHEYEFARDLKQRWPWLRTASVHQIARVLRLRSVDPRRWVHTKDLHDVTTYESFRLPGGHYRIPDAPENALGVLAGYLALTLPPLAELTPAERRAEHRQVRSDRVIDDTSTRPTLTAAEHEQIAEIIARSNAEIRSHNEERAAQQIRRAGSPERLQAARAELEQLRARFAKD